MHQTSRSSPLRASQQTNSKRFTSLPIDAQTAAMVREQVHSMTFPISLLMPSRPSSSRPSSSESCPYFQEMAIWMARSRRRRPFTSMLLPEMARIFWQASQLRKVLQAMAREVSRKKEAAQRWCQWPLRMPVSILAVLPMRAIEPIRPRIIATSGRYTSMRKARSLARLFRKKWLVSHPSSVSTDPEIVDIRKMMNSGQCPAHSLMQVLGIGGSWPSSTATRQMATRLPTRRQLAVLKNTHGENSPCLIMITSRLDAAQPIQPEMNATSINSRKSDLTAEIRAV